MLPPAPKRPKPDAFYLEYIPEFWQAFIEGAGLPDLRLEIQVEVEPEPLRYVILLDGDQVTSRVGLAEQPHVLVAFDMEAYRTASRDLWPRAVRRLQTTFDRARQRLHDMFDGVDADAWLESLLELPGELTLEHTDDAGDTTVTRVTIGTGPGARARIVSSDADAALLLGGKSGLLQLLKSRVKIDGDSGWVIRLATRLQPGA